MVSHGRRLKTSAMPCPDAKENRREADAEYHPMKACEQGEDLGRGIFIGVAEDDLEYPLFEGQNEGVEGPGNEHDRDADRVSRKEECVHPFHVEEEEAGDTRNPGIIARLLCKNTLNSLEHQDLFEGISHLQKHGEDYYGHKTDSPDPQNHGRDMYGCE